MSEMPKHPRLMMRGATYYHRVRVPKDLVSAFQRSELTESLNTKCPTEALRRVRAKAVEVDCLFDEHRARLTQPAAPLASIVDSAPQPITGLQLQKWSDDHYKDVYDTDFEWRADLWKIAKEDIDGFYHDAYIAHPTDGGYLAVCEELSPADCFVCCVKLHREERINALKLALAIGDCEVHAPAADEFLSAAGIIAAEGDKLRLVRKLMEAELAALEACQKADATHYDRIIGTATPAHGASPVALAAVTDDAGPLMSKLTPTWIAEGKKGGWPKRTIMRKAVELREFLTLVGDKPIRAYTDADGRKFKEALMGLPINRQVRPFKGLTLQQAIKKADEIDPSRITIKRQSAATINDKLGNASTFFLWAKASNPVADLKIKTKWMKRKGKRRFPFTVDELNKLFSAPIYTGCKSESRWHLPGTVIPRTSAKFWVPLIGLYTGLRLGEIIQLRVADVKSVGGVNIIDVTTQNDGDDGDGAKTLKDERTSRRAVPIHQILVDIGFLDFVAMRRAGKDARVFPDVHRATDDDSWSKVFGKHFTRFRREAGVIREGVAFHSFRHCMEDALRNADVRQDVRDAIQGHSESGTSAEYGTGFYFDTLNEAIQKIDHRGLDLSHLKKMVAE